ncbi:MAG TPA: LPS-assembly protein LptD [Candidatus Alistipes merdipullorum]|nr:LPS-assembly protein LptD [Candidatus Alistipes merdipullorum]
MGKTKLKYILPALAVLMLSQFVFGFAPTLRLLPETPDTDTVSIRQDTTPQQRTRRSERRRSERLARPAADTAAAVAADTVATDVDTVMLQVADTVRRAKKAGLDKPISGKASDSLYYDLRNKMVYIYEQGDVSYGDMNLKADFMNINIDNKNIYAYGKADTVDGAPVMTRPVFTQGTTTLNMDTITYNIESQRAKIKSIATQQGDGWLVGTSVKKMEDNTINIEGGMYTTCDQTDHPHFYLAMTKAKVIPGKKAITGPAYLVMEDVPIYFLGVPEGFFPLNTGPKSGILMPTYGEEATRGFYIRGLGYYFTLSEHMDLALTGGIYTLGSWEANVRSRYIKRYKYSGNLNFDFSSVKSGDKGDADYIKQNTFKLQWTHSQDAKANPGSTFSASVNLASSGYSKYSANTLNDMLSTQTNSSISYSKNWAGTPFSLSMNMAVSQNSQTKAISVTLPTVSFNVSRFYPFKRAVKIGKDRWYEKISMSYSGKLTNSVSATESDIFSRQTLDNMRNGVQHTIPVQASFNVLNYINITPSFNYNERWYFKKVDRQWNPTTNMAEELDPEYGFYRLYDYTTALSFSTTLYGMWQVREKYKNFKLQAIRHTFSPSISFSYAPDFSNQKYGYFKTVQSDSTGRTTVYSPFADNAYGTPSQGRSMAMSFSLSQSLEAKVLSKRDSTGIKKISLIDDFSISGSYNFLADSMKLSNISLSLRSTFSGKIGINLRATLDPYEVSPEGIRYNKLTWRRGNLGRIINTGWSFGYSFKSRDNTKQPAINDINSVPPEYMNPFYDPYGTMDPVLRRQYMANAYYDFSLPWNIGFNYAVNYSVSYVNNGTTGIRRNITQTIGFNGSITFSPKMAATFSGGYDIATNKLTTSSISITRDLHCWQMSFSWIPFGYYKSWSFHIGVKAASLQDLKYDKSQSMYDNLY